MVRRHIASFPRHESHGDLINRSIPSTPGPPRCQREKSGSGVLRGCAACRLQKPKARQTSELRRSSAQRPLAAPVAAGLKLRRGRPIRSRDMGFPSSRPRLGWWLCLVCVIVLTSPACRVKEEVPQVLRVGVLANFTGEYAETSGTPLREGAELATHRINKTGGVRVGGRSVPIELFFKDFENRADAAATAARTLINQDRVDVLVGPPFSRHAIPVSVLADRARVPMITPMSTNPKTTEGKRFVYRMSFLDDFQATAMARFAVRQIEARRAAVVYNVSSDYSRQMAEIFVREFTLLGGEVVAQATYTSDQERDYEVVFDRIIAESPDVLWLPNRVLDAVDQVQAARARGFTGTFLGGDTWDLSLIGSLPEAEGAFVVHQWHEELGNQATERFVALYRSHYSREPKITAAMTYDSFKLLESALEDQPDFSSESIRRGLEGVDALDGVTGSIRFDGARDPKRPAVIGQVESGRTKFYEVVDP